MRRKIWTLLIMMMVMCGCTCLLSACGDPHKDVSLDYSGGTIELILGDTEKESKIFEISINNFNKKLSGIIDFGIIGDSIKVTGLETSATSGSAKCKITAIRSGNAIVRATLMDGGQVVEIPVIVTEPIVSMSIKNENLPYLVKGENAQTLDPNSIINFNPTTTTQKDVYFIVGEEISNSFVIPESDERQTVSVTAVSEANENVRTTFPLRLISPIKDIKTYVEDVIGSDVSLSVNLNENNSKLVKIEMTSNEEELTCFNSFYQNDDFLIKQLNYSVSENIHTFLFQIQGVSAEAELNYIFRFGIKGGYTYAVSSEVNISSFSVPKFIAINLQTQNYETIRVFNYNSTTSRGTSLSFAVLPQNSRKDLQKGTITYDEDMITIYNSTKQIVESGTLLESGVSLWVKGKTGVIGSSEITFEVEGVEGISNPLTAVIPVEVYEGVRSIEGAGTIFLSLASDGSASDDIYQYSFDVTPSGAYTGEIFVEAKSSIIAANLDEIDSHIVNIKALSTGVTSFVISLPNGLMKIITVEVISSLDEHSLVVDAPNSSENDFVGSKTPVVVGRSQPLSSMVIQKSIAYEKAVPLTFSYYPLNASIERYDYTVTKISGEAESIVEIVGNSLVGRNEGKAHVSVKVSYAKLEGGIKVIKDQTFEFDVEVYVAVSQFYFSDTTLTVADLNTVGFYKISEATKTIKSHIYPTNATNGKTTNIVYSLSQGDISEEDENVLENDYISFNMLTGEITGRLEKGTTPNPTYITATLIDYTKIYSITITVNVVTYEQVKAIIVDNVTVPGGSISLTSGNPNFGIIAHAIDITAYNTTLVYSFIPANTESAGVVSVNNAGLVKLNVALANSANLGGFIRISAQDSFREDNINAELYVDIPVNVAIGTEESPFVISTKQELLALNTPEALAKYYKVVGVIDLSGEEIAPLGILTGGICGEKNSKIIGININVDSESKVGLFSEIATGATVKNLSFVGSINYMGEAEFIGLVAGVNNGTILNVSVELGESLVTALVSSMVGGVVGQNNSIITTDIIPSTFNYNLITMTQGATFRVVGGELVQVCVGGVAGCNGVDGLIKKTLKGVSLFNSDGYTANIRINTSGVYATGGVVGLNIGTCVGLSSCGYIFGEEYVGGFVGYMQNGLISISEEEDDKAKSLSNVFVVGDNYIGGFAGYISGGAITKSGIEIYEMISYLESDLYIVDAKGNAGGFVGGAYAGNISDCYVSSFRSSATALIRMNSIIPTNKVGAFAGALSGATIINCYSNITCLNLGVGGVDDIVYDGSFKPVIPTNVEINVLENEMTSGQAETFKVIYLNYFKSVVSNNQSLLSNEVVLGDYISHNLSDAGVQIVSKNSSILKITNTGLYIAGTGLCEVIISSRYNPDLSVSLYVYVVNYNSNILITKIIGDNEYSLDEDTIISMSKTDVVTLDKNSIEPTVDTIKLVAGSSYNVSLDTTDFSVNNYKNVFTVSPISGYDGDINKNREIAISAFYQVEIDGKVFVSSSFSNVDCKFKVFVGTNNIQTDSIEYSITTNDKLIVNFAFDSDLGEEEIIKISSNKTIKLNNSVLLAGQTTVIWDKTNPANSFSVEMIDKSYTGKVVLSFSDSNNIYNKDISLNIIPQGIEAVSSRFFKELPNINYDISQTTNLVTPGTQGLMVLDVLPRYADVSYIELINDETNPVNIQFDLVKQETEGVFVKSSGAILVPGGIRIPSIVFKKDGYLSSILMKLLVSTVVDDNVELKIKVYSNVGFIQDITLITKHIEKVTATIEGKDISTGEAYLAKNLTYKLNVSTVGFSLSQAKVVASDTKRINIVKESDTVYLINVLNPITYSNSLTISVYGEKEIDGVIVRSSVQVIKINIVDFVVNGISFENSVQEQFNEEEIDVINGYIGVVKKLGVELVNGFNAEYDISNSAIVAKVNKFVSELNSKKDNFEISGDYASEFDYDEIQAEFKPKKVASYNELSTSFNFESRFSYIDGLAVVSTSPTIGTPLTRTLKVNANQLSTSTSMIPIYNYNDFINMEENNYYVLVEGFSIPETYTPLSVNIAGFDGNNKIITMTGYENKIDTSTNFGLFSRVGENTIIQNVVLHVQSFEASITANDVNFGFIASENEGVITNCYVYGTSAKISFAESATYAGDKYVGGIVGRNSGFVTNSRVEISIFTASGNFAGIASVNSGIISSCYVKGSTLINNSSFTNVMTAGVVCENMLGGKVYGSYIEGKTLAHNSIYYNDSTSIRANSKIGGFVFANAGTISDCYSNIYILSGSIAGGFIYENKNSGVVLNCYSLSLLRVNTANNYPFVAKDEAGEINNTAGEFINCYFCYAINQWHTTANLGIQGITRIGSISDFAKVDSFEGFGLSTQSSPTKGVWSLYDEEGNVLDYPVLISANNIVSVSKTLDKTVRDEQTGTVLYFYTNLPNGSIDNPFIITSAKELEDNILQSNVSNINTAYYRLVADIDYSSTENGILFSSLYKTKFCGELDGNGLDIINYSINSVEKMENAGLFATVGSNSKSGVVKNVNIIPKQINTPNASRVGALAGSIIGGGVYNVNVSNLSNQTGIMLKGLYRVGGLAGYMTNSNVFISQIINCSSSMSANATAINQSSDEIKKNTTGIYLVTDTIVNLKITGIAGGLVGMVESGKIVFSSVHGNVNIIGQIASAFVGYVGTNSELLNCSLTVNLGAFVRSPFAAGGLVGYNMGVLKNCSIDGTTEEFFRSGNIPPKFIGGLVAINEGKIIGNASLIKIELDIIMIDVPVIGGVVGKLISGEISGYKYVGNLKGKENVAGIAGMIVELSNNIALKNLQVGYDEAEELTSSIEAYGISNNSVGVIVGNMISRIVDSLNNICTQKVFFTRNWLGETQQENNFTAKTINEEGANVIKSYCSII